MKKIAILGSTGSIGTQTLSVVREHGDIEVTALAAGHNIAKLEEQIREFHPALVAVWAEEDAIELRTRVADLKVKVASGMEGLLEVATEEKVYESLMDSGYDEITCVVLTGMDADGTKGISELQKEKNVYVIAQDEETSVVYGMPKAIAETGLVDEIVPLESVADTILKNVGVN